MLDKAVILATRMESAVHQAETTAADSSIPVQAVQPHTRASKIKHKQNTHLSKPPHVTKSAQSCLRQTCVFRQTFG